MEGFTEDNMNFLGRESLFMLDTPLHKGKKLSIRFEPKGYEFYQLRVSAADGMPVPIESATAYAKSLQDPFSGKS